MLLVELKPPQTEMRIEPSSNPAPKTASNTDNLHASGPKTLAT